MPELPEVEIVRRGIQKDLPRSEIIKVKTLRPDLRFPLPLKKLKNLKNQKILNIDRRGKFLIFKTSSTDFISHLGMTGHWRYENKYKPQKHDHIIFVWEHLNLIYNDPRRFGYILNHDINSMSQYGPDPIEDHIDALEFSKRHKKSRTAIKTFLLNQKNILGIGNIYASEILYKSKIHPLKSVHKVSSKNWSDILSNTNLILNQAINLGGSTLRDYKNVDGKMGQAQTSWKVYGREDQNCFDCKTKIKNITISNRSTYFCSKCQK